MKVAGSATLAILLAPSVISKPIAHQEHGGFQDESQEAGLGMSHEDQSQHYRESKSQYGGGAAHHREETGECRLDHTGILDQGRPVIRPRYHRACDELEADCSQTGYGGNSMQHEGSTSFPDHIPKSSNEGLKMAHQYNSRVPSSMPRNSAEAMKMAHGYDERFPSKMPKNGNDAFEMGHQFNGRVPSRYPGGLREYPEMGHGSKSSMPSQSHHSFEESNTMMGGERMPHERAHSMMGEGAEMDPHGGRMVKRGVSKTLYRRHASPGKLRAWHHFKRPLFFPSANSLADSVADAKIMAREALYSPGLYDTGKPQGRSVSAGGLPLFPRTVPQAHRSEKQSLYRRHSTLYPTLSKRDPQLGALLKGGAEAAKLAAKGGNTVLKKVVPEKNYQQGANAIKAGAEKVGQGLHKVGLHKAADKMHVPNPKGKPKAEEHKPLLQHQGSSVKHDQPPAPPKHDPPPPPPPPHHQGSVKHDHPPAPQKKDPAHPPPPPPQHQGSVKHDHPPAPPHHDPAHPPPQHQKSMNFFNIRPPGDHHPGNNPAPNLGKAPAHPHPADAHPPGNHPPENHTPPPPHLGKSASMGAAPKHDPFADHPGEHKPGDGKSSSMNHGEKPGEKPEDANQPPEKKQSFWQQQKGNLIMGGVMTAPMLAMPLMGGGNNNNKDNKDKPPPGDPNAKPPDPAVKPPVVRAQADGKPPPGPPPKEGPNPVPLPNAPKNAGPPPPKPHPPPPPPPPGNNNNNQQTTPQQQIQQQEDTQIRQAKQQAAQQQAAQTPQQQPPQPNNQQNNNNNNNNNNQQQHRKRDLARRSLHHRRAARDAEPVVPKLYTRAAAASARRDALADAYLNEAALWARDAEPEADDEEHELFARWADADPYADAYADPYADADADAEAESDDEHELFARWADPYADPWAAAEPEAWAEPEVFDDYGYGY